MASLPFGSCAGYLFGKENARSCHFYKLLLLFFLQLRTAPAPVPLQSSLSIHISDPFMVGGTGGNTCGNSVGGSKPPGEKEWR